MAKVSFWAHVNITLLFIAEHTPPMANWPDTCMTHRCQSLQLTAQTFQRTRSFSQSLRVSWTFCYQYRCLFVLLLLLTAVNKAAALITVSQILLTVFYAASVIKRSSVRPSVCPVDRQQQRRPARLLHWRSQGGGGEGHAPPPKLGSQENSWLRRWAKYTKLCMVWQPNIINNCYELSGGYAPPNHPPGALPLDSAGGLPFPRPPVPPPPNPGYATGLLLRSGAGSRYRSIAAAAARYTCREILVRL